MSYRNLRAVLLAGGVGGARMARALAAVLPPGQLTVVVNVGDDDDIYGVRVCADLDTVLYTAAGMEGPAGWGVAGDTFEVMDQLEAAGIDTSFRLGDRDLGHCLARTLHLEEGTLSEFTRGEAARRALGFTLLPATDDKLRTTIISGRGERLDFQDYFVRRRQRDEVVGLDFVGAGTAKPAPGVVEAIQTADVVFIAPSNPPLSVWPILAIEEIGAAVAEHPRVIAVSPLIGGRAVKGPLVAVMDGLGLTPGHTGICAAYEGLIDSLVVDTSDAGEAGSIEARGIEPIVAPTLIAEPEAGVALARILLDSLNNMEHRPWARVANTSERSRTNNTARAHE